MTAGIPAKFPTASERIMGFWTATLYQRSYLAVEVDLVRSSPCRYVCLRVPLPAPCLMVKNAIADRRAFFEASAFALSPLSEIKTRGDVAHINVHIAGCCYVADSP